MSNFDKLPHDTNKLIGSYLDYYDRVNFNRVLTNVNDKYTKKINIKEHIYLIDYTTYMHYVFKAKSGVDRTDRAYKIMEIFEYLLSRKDSEMFNYPKFRREIIYKTEELTRPESIRNLDETTKIYVITTCCKLAMFVNNNFVTE